MEGMMTTKEAAGLWGISDRRVSKYCNEGRITGAVKSGSSWLIPVGTGKPMDKRRRASQESNYERLPLPVGISDYRSASTKYYYVDKTLLIRDFLDEQAKVSLFTRPRRFGKTLNMDMIRTFFEKTDEDTSVYFKNKNIWKAGKKYRDHQGKYPAIFVTFKDVKFSSWEKTLQDIGVIFAQEYLRHQELRASEKCNAYEQEYYEKIIARMATEEEMTHGLQMLSQMLDEHYGIAPIIIIDEYDTPIQQGHSSGFYDDVVGFMRNLFSGGLKDNPHLTFGFMTGILRVAKESIFSGLNNLKINSVLDNRYSEYFGFTHDEVLKMAAYFMAEDKYREICDWYDGYQFGRTEIFNPWSVINYFANECQPKAFWQSTGSNDVINEILMLSDGEATDNLTRLLHGESLKTMIDTSVIYPQIHNNPASIFSFLLMAGYLKPVGERMLIGSNDFYAVAIPNKEIAGVYRNEILGKLENIIPQSTASKIQLAVYSNDAKGLQQGLRKLLLQSGSYYDTMGENFYHGLMLGLCAAMDQYRVTSNREAGEGRYDICLMPKAIRLPGVLIELKASKGCAKEKLAELAQAALQQIRDQHYDTELRSQGVQTVYNFGVAFSGKEVEVKATCDRFGEKGRMTSPV